MSEIQKINLNDIDFKWDKVSTTAAGAASGKGFLNESNIIKDAWADELELEKVDDAYLLSQDGTPMGFIDSKTAEDYMNSEKAAHKQSNKAVDNGNNNIEKKPLTDALKEKGVLSDPAEKKAEIAETINNNLKVDETNSNQIENTKNNLNKSLIDALREKGLLLDPNKEKVDITENLIKNLKIDDNESKISPVVDDSTANDKIVQKELTKVQVDKMLEIAESQCGVRYNSMNYGPAEEGGDGFGCAMLVSYIYNNILFNGVRGDSMDTPGFYGSTYEYWGNVTRDGYDPHNKGFIEVPAEEAQPGDVVAYTEGYDPYESAQSCGHVALYIGDGEVIGANGTGSGDAAVGQVEVTSVEAQAYGRDAHYLHYVGVDDGNK